MHDVTSDLVGISFFSRFSEASRLMQPQIENRAQIDSHRPLESPSTAGGDSALLEKSFTKSVEPQK